MKKRGKFNLLDVSATRSRPEEEKFFEMFSNVQINAVLLFILSATFLATGLTSYIEIVKNTELLNRWLVLLIFSIMSLIISVYSISLAGTLHPLKGKKIANMISFVSFLFGASIFFISLIILVIILL